MSFTPLFRSKHKPAPEFRPSFNVGACMDLPTAEFYTGKHGEYIMSAGFGNMVAYSGPGNSNKTGLADFCHAQMLDRLLMTAPSQYSKYDTEEQASPARFVNLCKYNKLYLNQVDLLDSGMYLLTNRATEPGEEYYDTWKKGLESKVKDKLPLQRTPFVTRSGEYFHILPPTQNSIDSITDFTTSSSDELLVKHELNDSKTNRVFMVQGRDKSVMLMEMPVYTSRYNDYMTITTHVGKKGADMSGPAKPPSKSNTHMKADERIKGLTEKVYYMFSAYWLTSVSRTYWQDGTKLARYPKSPDVAIDNDIDLQTTDITLIRGKGGAGSGTRLTIVSSQKEGVNPYLTELDYVRNNGGFGILGNSTTWSLALLPELKMTRNTTRSKFDNDYKLQRAMNITSEICQANNYFKTVFPWLPDDMNTVVEGLKANGYDIDFLLENTRGWWTLNEEKHPLKYLCFLDVVRMSLGTYHPYWLEDDKKTIKKEYRPS